MLPIGSAGSTRDHPRIRGEHSRRGVGCGHGRGSSPHTRGARPHQRMGKHPMRIIPAYAGSTRTTRRWRPPCWDHPRIRGEHRGIGSQDIPGVGSSPHTRGALRFKDEVTRACGIIPAYAGSTTGDTTGGYSERDHPRIRGEHGISPVCWAKGWGSSPHTRGAPHPGFNRSAPAGIIPAYAGSTPPRPLITPRRPDHPRIRGEHIHVVGQGEASGWIIPAYAGSTPPRIFPRMPGWDHPRIRGEHLHQYAFSNTLPGSSPHTRGAPTPVCI